MMRVWRYPPVLYEGEVALPLVLMDYFIDNDDDDGVTSISKNCNDVKTYL